MLADALEHLVRGLVPNPDDVRVREADRAAAPPTRGMLTGAAMELSPGTNVALPSLTSSSSAIA